MIQECFEFSIFEYEKTVKKESRSRRRSCFISYHKISPCSEVSSSGIEDMEDTCKGG